MSSDRILQGLADLAVQIGVNLQAGQRLLVIGPLASGGVALDGAPLVRAVTASAYRAGADLVEVLWGDEPLQAARFELARAESFSAASRWLPGALAGHVDAGDAVLSIYANDPDQLSGQDPARIAAVQQATALAVRPFRERIARNDTNWSVVAAASPAWARKVFPGVPAADAVRRLWEAIGRYCRLDETDPVGVWRSHLASLSARKDWLNERAYAALRYSAPGTALTVGLPDGHRWVAGQSTSRGGVVFAPNLPTEEVFTMPHKDRVTGIVSSSKPLSYGGTLIEDFSVEFRDGRIVNVRARNGLQVLEDLVATDDGAGRLGEIALVPHGSPISRSGLLFFNTLLDENAASHLAIGSAYRFTMAGGEAMEEEAFERAGGNRSAVHVDFMIGSEALDVDGVGANGRVEPVMRAGEWVTGDQEIRRIRR
jgi:aminopeptidase